MDAFNAAGYKRRGSGDDQTFDIDVFEKYGTVGGVWDYKERVGSNSPTTKTIPMYRSLRTNLPREVMSFSSYPWNLLPSAEGRSYITHSEVGDYLKSYSHRMGVNQYIKSNSEVEKIQFDESSPSSGKIIVQTSSTTSTYDHVVVCNGHYESPSVPPSLLPLSTAYGSSSFHSVEYDR